MQVVYCRAFVAQKAASVGRQSRKMPSESETACLPLSQGSFCSEAADSETTEELAAGGKEPFTEMKSKKGRLSSWKRRAAAKAHEKQTGNLQNGENKPGSKLQSKQGKLCLCKAEAMVLPFRRDFR